MLFGPYYRSNQIMKNEKLNEILKQALLDIKDANTLETINVVRNRYFAKKSELASLGSIIATLPEEEKKDFGREMHEVKTQIAAELDKKLQSEAIDITLPGRGATLGARNPFHVIIDEITYIFLGMAYTVA